MQLWYLATKHEIRPTFATFVKTVQNWCTTLQAQMAQFTPQTWQILLVYKKYGYSNFLEQNWMVRAQSNIGRLLFVIFVKKYRNYLSDKSRILTKFLRITWKSSNKLQHLCLEMYLCTFYQYRVHYSKYITFYMLILANQSITMLCSLYCISHFCILQWRVLFTFSLIFIVNCAAVLFRTISRAAVSWWLKQFGIVHRVVWVVLIMIMSSEDNIKGFNIDTTINW